MPAHYSAAVIGAGRMGATTSDMVRIYAPPCWFPLSHLDALATHERVRVDAICDHDPERVERALAAHGTARGYSDFESVLTECSPDILTIATRTPGRSDIILGALQRGIRALHIEKPLCSSIDELNRLERAFASDNVFVTYGAIRRLFGVYRQARDIADSGQLGALTEFSVRFGTAGLYWAHPHSVDLILFAAGQRRVTAVHARLSNLVTGDHGNQIMSDPIIDHAAIMFDDGAIGHITRSPGGNFAISGTSGEIAVEADGHELLVLSQDDEDPYPKRLSQPVAAGTEPEGTYLAIAQLVDCLDGNKRAIAANQIVKRDILLGHRILFAFVQSHLEGGRPVRLDEIDPHIEVKAVTNGNPA